MKYKYLGKITSKAYASLRLFRETCKIIFDSFIFDLQNDKSHNETHHNPEPCNIRVHRKLSGDEHHAKIGKETKL